ncbi:acyltransferase [Deltaproteobacteria bacterium PRO3]|nr:acyltransferase [Deltaproteobacteria bacterium PRO3]
MSQRLSKYLLKSRIRMLVFNQVYVYFIHLLHVALDLLPGFLRNAAFKALLAKCGRMNFFDYGVYFKFPRLVELGSQVSINRGAEFYPSYIGNFRIFVGSDVVIGSHSAFYTAGPDPDHLSNYRGGDIRVGDHVWIGGHAVILPGVTVGQGSIVGAGSVVTRDIPPYAIVAGSPAEVLRFREVRYESSGADLPVACTERA